MQQFNKAGSGWSVGLMTGTVLDGHIDVAMIRTDGESILEFGPCTMAEYAPALNQSLQQTLAVALDWQFRGKEPAIFATVEQELSAAQAIAVSELVQTSGMSLAEVEVVGFHGQSVLHRRPGPQQAGRTRQLGDGQLMANMLGVPVVYDFRSADVAAGGQGAPLAPVYHRALLQRAAADASTAVLNLGGVANITWWDGEQQLVAFDTGPASAPLNDFVSDMGLGAMDTDGKLAAAGTVDEQRLQIALQHPYFKEKYPKSLDRFDFSTAMADGCTVEDGAALLTAFTASAVGLALDSLPTRPTRLIVCGGGRHNPELMRVIEARAVVKVESADNVGWRGDFVEAECFAFLAQRALQGLPLSFPNTTGVANPMTGGKIAMAKPHKQV